MLLREIEHFLEEDTGQGDYEPIVPHTDSKAEITAKEEGVLAGLEEVKEILDYLSVQYSSGFEDGARIRSGDTILTVRGAGAEILRAERLVLNFMGRMSGIATLTDTLVNEARGVNPRIRVAGTRKTTPGFRKYEKKAIRIGGGDPHRFGLYETVIIKDNHIKLMGLENAITKAKESTSFTKKIEVEVESIAEALRAVELKVDIIMLDNMTAAEVKDCVRLLSDKGLRDGLILEASGGIDMKNIKEFASTDVDVVSVGMLTHSAKWLGFSMNVVE